MEVHAHSHTPRKKWTHYLWEFLMLFLAVTLGFFVENKREHIIEHKRAKAYALMLKQDLINDTLQLGFFINGNDSLQETFSRILATFKKNKDSVTLSDFHAQNNNSIDLAIFFPNDATYSQLKSSGNLRYFGNTILVGKLGNYEETIKRLEASWNTTQKYYGGVSSEHYLQYKINSKKFFEKNSGKNPVSSIKALGYGFQSWDEVGIITENFMEILLGFHQFVYPELKKIAVEIIELLNKEYHLK